MPTYRERSFHLAFRSINRRKAPRPIDWAALNKEPLLPIRSPQFSTSHNMCTVMIDDSPKVNTSKRRLDSLNLACCGTRRGKVFSYFPAVENHRNQDTDFSECSTPSINPADIVPTAADYANLVFCSSDDEEEEEVIDEPIKKRRRVAKRRSVSFGAYIPLVHHLHDTPLASEMTQEEKSALWLNSQEIEEMKVSANTTTQNMRSLVVASHSLEERTTFRALMVQLEQETNSSIRGLEHRVFRRKVPRQVLVDEVLECQKHIQGLAKFGHSMSMEDKATLLANVSTKRSSSALSMALVNAKNDSIEVQERVTRLQISI